MAWTEQCKIAFRTNASARIAMEKKRRGAITKILKKLSKESDIPFKTLNRWYYEKYDISETDNATEANDPCPKNEVIEDYSKIICTECGEKPIYLNHGKKPYGIESKYHGLCGSCRARKMKIEYFDREATGSSRIPAVCPACGETHYINKERIKKWMQS